MKIRKAIRHLLHWLISKLISSPILLDNYKMDFDFIANYFHNKLSKYIQKLRKDEVKCGH